MINGVLLKNCPLMNVLFRQLANKIHNKIGIHQIFMRAQLLWNHFHSLGSRFMGSHNFSGSFEGYFVGSVMEIPLMNIKQMIVIKFVGMLIHGQRLP